MIKFKVITGQDEVIALLAKEIGSKLEKGGKVLWLVAGGSSIPIAIEVAKIISQQPHQSLTVTLTDERFGPIDHADSNWYQLTQKGFSLPDARLMPVLTGEDRDTTTKKFDDFLNTMLVDDIFKIGLFGIGPDGHTAGILPNTGGVEAETLAYGYSTPNFERITMTARAISKLDEAIVFAMGEAKWPTLAKLEEDISMSDQPAQALKAVPITTVFTDYQ